MAKICNEPSPHEVLTARNEILQILPTDVKNVNHPIKFGHDGKSWFFACFLVSLGINKPGTFHVKHSNLVVIISKILSEVNSN